MKGNILFGALLIATGFAGAGLGALIIALGEAGLSSWIVFSIFIFMAVGAAFLLVFGFGKALKRWSG